MGGFWAPEALVAEMPKLNVLLAVWTHRMLFKPALSTAYMKNVPTPSHTDIAPEFEVGQADRAIGVLELHHIVLTDCSQGVLDL